MASTSLTQLPILHVEVRVKRPEPNMITRTELVRAEVSEWLIRNFVVLSVGQEINSFAGVKWPHCEEIESIKITDCTGGNLVFGGYRLRNVDLDVQVYRLYSNHSDESFQTSEGSAEASEDIPKAQVMKLPHEDLDGLWESLHFDEPIKATLLRAIGRMVSFSMRKLNSWSINWNRLILLYGPPGTGKSSLCRGLAQMLAIRLGNQISDGKLIEINAQSLGSKYFNESGKHVEKVFDDIESMLKEQEDALVCVLVDEIETLAAKREQILTGNEPFDGVRAVNALLTGLDRLRHHPNVVVLCTSNYVSALDPAFIDRVDIKQFMPLLPQRVIYGIYKDVLEELNRCGMIDGCTFDVIQVKPGDPRTPLKYIERPSEKLVLPTYDEMNLNHLGFEDSVAKELAQVATVSSGLSGRALRRLPVLSLVLHTTGNRCSIRVALEALRRGIEAELQAKMEAFG